MIQKKGIFSAAQHSRSEWAVRMNGKAILTPKGVPLLLPSQKMAEHISQEWQRQDMAKINPSSMPIQQMAASALDIIAPDPQAYRSEILKYGTTDLLCYRADADRELAARQIGSWQPLLDWFALTHNVHLRVTKSIIAIDQPDLPRLKEHLERYDSWRLAALGVGVPNMGSLVLGMALLAGKISVETAHLLAHLEQLYQEEKWGQDKEALLRRKSLKNELQAVQLFLDLLPEEEGKQD